MLPFEGLFRSDSESIYKFQKFNDNRPTIRVAECGHNKLQFQKSENIPVLQDLIYWISES